MEETSDDRNGVVVNRPIDSTRGIPNCLVEQRTSRSEIHAKSGHKSALQWLVGPKSGFLQLSTATSTYVVLEQKIKFYEANKRTKHGEPSQASLAIGMSS